MPLPKPSAVRFEISVRARLTRNALGLIGKEVVTEAVERWLEDGTAPSGFSIRVTIWSHGKGRSVDPGDDSKGERLRAVLRGALQSGRIQIKQVGHTGRKA